MLERCSYQKAKKKVGGCALNENIFISGETIDLCAPLDTDFETWASWFNDRSVTRFLDQGRFPNTTDEQKSFYASAKASGRLVLLVKSKEHELLGVVNLSNINYARLTCEVAYVCPVKSKSARYAALEALAFITQHAFDNLNMCVVSAGHAYPGLISWIRKTETLGYKTNGFFPQNGFNGSSIYDAVWTSVTRERYQSLIRRRGGVLWPGGANMEKIMLALRDLPPLSEIIASKVMLAHMEHDKLMEKIDGNES